MSCLSIYNLEEFAERNQLKGLYGSALVCFSADQEMLRKFKNPGTLSSFYAITLMVEGWQEYLINMNRVRLEMNDLFISLPYINYVFKNCSDEMSSSHLLVEKNFFEDLISHNEQLQNYSPMEIFSTFPVLHLGKTQAASFFYSFDNIRKTIINPHLYKNELIKYQLNICLLMMAELISGQEIDTHDLKYKDNILKIFLHLASRHFRKERQIQFYADNMNISPTYLSRTIKELTGNTVMGYLSNFLYNEICIQLKTSEKNINEIAFDLNFSDQSALTNFFRNKSGVTPLAYRKGGKSRREHSPCQASGWT
jgi:AraC-like DNA-binding protein